jgi:predicted hydrolase (HD superfamily)
MQNQNLRRHCYAVGLAMKAYYNYYQGEGRDLNNLTEEDWEVAGLLHDSDYELTKEDWGKHTLVLLEWLKDYNVKPELLDVFKTHNNKITGLKEPQTLIEWTLECCDELTGFIVACALVMPSKKLADVTVESVLKKFDQPAFARAVDRSQITQCQEKVGVPVNKFVEITLKTMQEESDLLGL